MAKLASLKSILSTNDEARMTEEDDGEAPTVDDAMANDDEGVP